MRKYKQNAFRKYAISARRRRKNKNSPSERFSPERTVPISSRRKKRNPPEESSSEEKIKSISSRRKGYKKYYTAKELEDFPDEYEAYENISPRLSDKITKFLEKYIEPITLSSILPENETEFERIIREERNMISKEEASRRINKLIKLMEGADLIQEKFPMVLNINPEQKKAWTEIRKYMRSQLELFKIHTSGERESVAVTTYRHMFSNMEHDLYILLSTFYDDSQPLMIKYRSLNENETMEIEENEYNKLRDLRIEIAAKYKKMRETFYYPKSNEIAKSITKEMVGGIEGERIKRMAEDSERVWNSIKRFKIIGREEIREKTREERREERRKKRRFLREEKRRMKEMEEMEEEEEEEDSFYNQLLIDLIESLKNCSNDMLKFIKTLTIAVKTWICVDHRNTWLRTRMNKLFSFGESLLTCVNIGINEEDKVKFQDYIQVIDIYKKAIEELYKLYQKGVRKTKFVIDILRRRTQVGENRPKSLTSTNGIAFLIVNIDLISSTMTFNTFTEFLFKVNNGKGTYPIWMCIYELIRKSMIYSIESKLIWNNGGIVTKFEWTKIDPTSDFGIIERVFWTSYREKLYNWTDISVNLENWIIEQTDKIWKEIAIPSDGSDMFITKISLTFIDRSKNNEERNEETTDIILYPPPDPDILDENLFDETNVDEELRKMIIDMKKNSNEYSNLSLEEVKEITKDYQQSDEEEENRNETEQMREEYDLLLKRKYLLEKELEEKRRSLEFARKNPPPIKKRRYERSKEEEEDSPPPPPSRRNRGSCEEKRGKKHYIYNHILLSAKGKDGSCFFSALSTALMNQHGKNINIGIYKRERIEIPCRKYLSDMGIQTSGGISIKEVELLQKLISMNIEIYKFNEEGELILSSSTENSIYSITINLVLHDGHYYVDKGLVGEKTLKGQQCIQCKTYFKDLAKHSPCPQIKCNDCGSWFKKNHICAPSKQNFWNYMYSDQESKSTLSCNVAFYDQYVGDKNIIIYDLETHIDENNQHIAYALGFALMKNENDIKLYSLYGYKCIYKFIKFIDELEAGSYKIIGYNNSKYDNHFLLGQIVANGNDPEMILQDGNTLTRIKYSIGKKDNKVKIIMFDLHRFFGVPTKLQSAVKAFGVGESKGCFPYDFLNEKRRFNDNIINYIGDIPEKKYWNELPLDYDINNNNWNLKTECLKYMMLDVKLTLKLYLVMSKEIWTDFKVNMGDYVTISQLSYAFWTSTILPNSNLNGSYNWSFNFNKPTRTTAPKIFLPNAGVYSLGFEATIGGRTYPVKRNFESKYFENIINGTLKYEDLQEDYIKILDVVSLYPTAMKELDAPVGMWKELNETQIKDLNIIIGFNEISFFQVGIYKINFKPNKRLMHPVLARKLFKKDKFGQYTSSGLIWDLNDGSGTYTSIELNQAFYRGYEIVILEGIVWEKTERVFETFIDFIFKLKANAEDSIKNALNEDEKAGPRARRANAKNMMNSLYGKMIQKLVYDDYKIVRNSQQSATFITTHIMSDILVLQNDKKDVGVILKGLNPKTPNRISKPNYYGCFILSKSREIMWKYYDIVRNSIYPLVNLEFKCLLNIPQEFNELNDQDLIEMACSMFNGDTDSIHTLIHSNNHNEYLNTYINSSKLGFLSNDLKDDDGKIIRAIYISPKTYYIQWIGKDNIIRWTAKCKGIPTKSLLPEMYFSVLNGTINIESMVKIKSFYRIGAKTPQKDLEINPFSIFSKVIDRSFAKKYWEGRKFFKDFKFQPSLPIGYEQCKYN